MEILSLNEVLKDTGYLLQKKLVGDTNKISHTNKNHRDDRENVVTKIEIPISASLNVNFFKIKVFAATSDQ